jgi:hypothetical protein
MGRPKPTHRTTLNVENTTRDLVNELVGKRGRTVDEVILYLLGRDEEAPKATTRREI